MYVLHVRMYARVCIRMHICIRMHVCRPISVCVHVYMCMYLGTHINYVYLCYAYSCVYRPTFVCIYRHIFIYVYTLLCIYVCTPWTSRVKTALFHITRNTSICSKRAGVSTGLDLVAFSQAAPGLLGVPPGRRL